MTVNYPGFAGGDRTDLRLRAPAHLLEALHGTGKPVVMVLTVSAPSPWTGREHLPAILMSWYPGQRGGTAIGQCSATSIRRVACRSPSRQAK